MRSYSPMIEVLLGQHCALSDRCWYGFITALIIGLIIGKPIIVSLKSLSIKQVFRTRQQVHDLAILHHSKIGVPTMGGIIVMAASLVAMFIWASFNDLVLIALMVYLFCSFVGWLDDYLKIRRGNSKGLSSELRLMSQALITIVVVALTFVDPPLNDLLMRVEWKWVVSHLSPEVILGATVVFYFFVIAGTANAVNITDGIDGLAISNIFLCFVISIPLIT